MKIKKENKEQFMKFNNILYKIIKKQEINQNSRKYGYISKLYIKCISLKDGITYEFNFHNNNKIKFFELKDNNLDMLTNFNSY